MSCCRPQYALPGLPGRVDLALEGRTAPVSARTAQEGCKQSSGVFLPRDEGNTLGLTPLRRRKQLLAHRLELGPAISAPLHEGNEPPPPTPSLQGIMVRAASINKNKQLQLGHQKKTAPPGIFATEPYPKKLIGSYGKFVKRTPPEGLPPPGSAESVPPPPSHPPSPESKIDMYYNNSPDGVERWAPGAAGAVPSSASLVHSPYWLTCPDSAMSPVYTRQRRYLLIIPKSPPIHSATFFPNCGHVFIFRPCRKNRTIFRPRREEETDPRNLLRGSHPHAQHP